jgi:hypothetical protein
MVDQLTLTWQDNPTNYDNFAVQKYFIEGSALMVHPFSAARPL